MSESRAIEILETVALESANSLIENREPHTIHVTPEEAIALAALLGAGFANDSNEPARIGCVPLQIG